MGLIRSREKFKGIKTVLAQRKSRRIDACVNSAQEF